MVLALVDTVTTAAITKIHTFAFRLYQPETLVMPSSNHPESRSFSALAAVSPFVDQRAQDFFQWMLFINLVHESTEFSSLVRKERFFSTFSRNHFQ